MSSVNRGVNPKVAVEEKTTGLTPLFMSSVNRGVNPTVAGREEDHRVNPAVTAQNKFLAPPPAKEGVGGRFLS